MTPRSPKAARRRLLLPALALLLAASFPARAQVLVKMATLAPSSTLAVLSTAPMPVVTPQPSRQTLSSGASLSIFASEISGTTVYSEKVEVPM